MIELLEHYFIVLIQCVGAIYFGLGIVLLFGKVPLAAEYLPYRKAKRCLAITYFIMGFNLVVYLAISSSADWKALNPYIKCTDFIFFYLEAIFFFSTFFYLLDEKYMSWRNFRKGWAIFLLSVVLMITSTIGVFGKVDAWVSWFPFFILFVQYVLFLRRFYILYNEKRRKLENYFAEDMQQFMSWIKKSIILVILTNVLSFTTLLGGIIYNYLFQVYVISANFYIAISFINYAAMYGKLNSAEVTDKERMETDTKEQKISRTDNYEQLFGEQVKRWLSEKRFLAPQLTIDDLAAEMGTNKLYMSRYINRKHGTNFSTWITKLRLEEAKSYMRENPNVKQEEVAIYSGFSSSSYFSRVFSRFESMTPAAWRKEQNV
jgi:hypothetical protein